MRVDQIEERCPCQIEERCGCHETCKCFCGDCCFWGANEPDDDFWEANESDIYDYPEDV